MGGNGPSPIRVLSVFIRAVEGASESSYYLAGTEEDTVARCSPMTAIWLLVCGFKRLHAPWIFLLAVLQKYLEHVRQGTRMPCLRLTHVPQRCITIRSGIRVLQRDAIVGHA